VCVCVCVLCVCVCMCVCAYVWACVLVRVLEENASDISTFSCISLQCVCVRER